MKAIKRDKKFIGAAVGAVANIAGGIIGGAKRRKAERKARQANQRAIAEQAETANAERAMALDQMYGNQEYVDEFKDKISLKNGGKVATKDRIKMAKKYALGGRSKKLYGSTTPTNQQTPTGQTANKFEKNKKTVANTNNKSSFSSEAEDALSGVSGLVGSLFSKPSEPINNNYNSIKYSVQSASGRLKPNSYTMDSNRNPINSTTKDGVAGSVDVSNTQYKDRLVTAKMGMRIQKRKK